MTKIQLKKHREKITRDLAETVHRFNGLHILEKYHLHCLEGLEKGYNIDLELGIRIHGKVAKEKSEKMVGSIRHKLQGCKKAEESLLHSLESIKKDIEICGVSPTGKRGRPRKNT